MKIDNIRDMIVEFYLDYVNNYLTVSRIAEDYAISEAAAEEMIKAGRAINEGEL